MSEETNNTAQTDSEDQSLLGIKLNAHHATHREEIASIRREMDDLKEMIQRKVENIDLEELQSHLIKKESPQDCREPREVVEAGIEIVPIDHDSANEAAVPRPPQQQQQSSVLNRYISMAGRLLGVGSVSQRIELNTGTLGMYAVAIAARRINTARAWLTAALFLIVILLEVFVFTGVIMEATYTNCHSIDDCLAGNYCSFRENTIRPVCEDCEHVQRPNDDTCSEIFSSEIWEDRDYAISSDYKELHLDRDFDYINDMNKYKCLAYNHCSQTDMDPAPEFEGTCDFLLLNMQKMDIPMWILTIFLSLMWTLPICQDIEESSIEEIVLNNHVKDSLNLPALIIHTALRIRKFIIPFFATSSTIILLLTDDISSKSIILNFLTVGFIFEADNVLAVLFLNSRHNELMDEVVKDVDGSASSAARALFFWTRVQGLVCAVILVTFMLFIQQFVTTCEEFGSYLKLTFIIPPLVIFAGQFFFNCAIRNAPSMCEKMSRALMDLLLNLLAGFISFLPSLTIDAIRYDGWALVSAFGIICIILFLMVLGLSMLIRKRYKRDDQEQVRQPDQHRAGESGEQVI
mmetsp:Transcript_63503/g.74356  ORF Transcript_63503/g.74356 Transcript_63503/m.74356 type:complete len:576 (-) Transcript_63503:61-1788(-)